MSSEYLVEVKDLKQYFPIRTGFMKTTLLKAVDGVNFGIKPGETLGLVGESGCGKTTVGRTLLRLYKPTGGEIYYDGNLITDQNMTASPWTSINSIPTKQSAERRSSASWNWSD